MTALIPTNIQVPAHLANRQGSALANAIGGGIGSGESVPRISIKAARFRIVIDGTETVLPQTTLEAIVVGANPGLSKTFYADAWTPDAEPTAPTCSSMDGHAPDANVADPQNDICATCPQNVWGSKTGLQGQKLKACSDSKRLAIVAAEDPTGPVYLLQVTPAALKGLNAYQRELSMRGIAPETVRTRISFDTDASFPKLVFRFGGFNDEATQKAIDELIGSPEVLTITGENAAPAAPPPPARAVPARAAAPVAPAPAPVAPPPAEAPKRGFGAPAAPAAPAEAPKRGFGAPAAAPTPAPAPAQAARRPGRPAKAAPVAAPPQVASGDLTSEIENMLAGMGNDDA